jgi:hypothetical protein
VSLPIENWKAGRALDNVLTEMPKTSLAAAGARHARASIRWSLLCAPELKNTGTARASLIVRASDRMPGHLTIAGLESPKVAMGAMPAAYALRVLILRAEYVFTPVHILPGLVPDLTEASSTLGCPAPYLTNNSSPPAMARFFMKFIICIWSEKFL